MISESSRATPRYLSDLLRNGTPAALGDTELLNRFASRRSHSDESAELAFAALLARHGPMVLRVCRGVLGDRHEVDDAFQATFLVLAVRARSIRRRGSVASWLHGVALRVAGMERARMTRRRRHELVKAAMTSSTTLDAGSDPVVDRELNLVIQEEIGRLPEKYRAPVVLCYLEGLTHEMAAEQLGWPVGSVKSRLAWARDRLRVRLTRRGVAPAGLPFDHAGSSSDAEWARSAVLPATWLADTTLRGALKAWLGRDSLVGIVSSEALALVEGILNSMTNARLLFMAASIVVAGMVTAGAGVLAYSVSQQENSTPPRNSGQTVRRQADAGQIKQEPKPTADTKPNVNQGPLMIQAEVVDPEGHRLAGTEVAVMTWYSRGSGDNEPVLARTKADGAGRVQLEVARERPDARVVNAFVWAYQPGRAIAMSDVALTGKASPPLIRLTLDQPTRWTITVLGADDRPIGGLRLTPHLVRLTDRRFSLPALPDEWLEPLTATTDANGVATLNYLPGTMVPLSIRVAGPGVAPHSLPYDAPQGKNAVLKLGRSGRVVGIVRTAAGMPLADVAVEVWVQGSGTLPTEFLSIIGRRITPDERLRLDQEPLKTGPQGAFQTPSTLLSGSTYRVSIRQDGYVPFVSDWVTLDGERGTIPPIRLQPLQRLTGQIRDRQGRAVAGARVFLPAGGPETATDGLGRFALAGVHPGKTVLLVEQTGFRLQGWLLDPSSQAEVGSRTLARTGEIPEPIIEPLADAISPEESRALADRLLEPYLRDPMENDNDSARLAAISALSEFDVDRALDLFQKGKFREDDFTYRRIQGLLSTKLAEKDPARAGAMVESITEPLMKVGALTKMAQVLPASERVGKQALLERATTLLMQQGNSGRRLQLISEVAEQWLDMGNHDRARLVLKEGKVSSEAFPTSFLGQLARIDPGQAMAQLKKQSARSNFMNRDPELAEVAVQLATDHPAEAEQVLNLQERGSAYLRIFDELRLCRRLATVDPPRARRVAESLHGPGARACGWAYVALGLAEKDKAGASAAMDRAIEEIDRLRESGPGPDSVTILSGIRLMYPTNPAAQILPVVERIAPNRLAEVFWRAVALHPRIETDRERQLKSSYISFECIVIARYDRELAAALFEPMDTYVRSLAAQTGPRDEFNGSAITAKVCIDPRGAVALIESLAPAMDSRQSSRALQSRLWLAEVLGLPREKRWMRLWRYMGTQLDD